MARCVHAHHATGEYGENLGYSCSFILSKLYPTDAAKCALMCAHFMSYQEPRITSTGIEHTTWLLAVAYADRWGVPPEIELVP